MRSSKPWIILAAITAACGGGPTGPGNPDSSYNIEVRYLSSPSTPVRQAFDAAVTRWRRVVTGDLPDIAINLAAGQCGSGSPAVNETIDDLVIFVTVSPIDGAGGTLAVSGPCLIRSPGNLPIMGQMQLDAADVPALGSDLNAVVLHEMGHVLGIGTLWGTEGLLADAGGSDPHFTGSAGIAAFNNIGGANYSGGKVPVQDTGGPGVADAHWRESVMGRELMTPFLNSGVANPLSAVTVASLGDQGYTVATSGADPFSITLSASPAVASQGLLRLEGDARSGPIYRVDGAGRVTELARP